MSGAGEWLNVESMDLDGQGVAHDGEGKVVFIEGALPGERVQVSVHRRKGQWEQGVMSAIALESASRVRPRCPHFGLHAGACGGCKMQHLDASTQVAIKQRALEDALWHLGKVRAQTVMRPIEGLAWGYRDRARLSVRHVLKKGAVLVGFHERKSSYVADMKRCDVLAPHVGAMLVPLRELVMSMDLRDRVPQIELAVGGDTTALVLRHLEPVGAADRARLRHFALRHPVQWWLQAKGPDTATPLDADDTDLRYVLPEFDVEIHFRPTDFTQVNHRVNEVLVKQALQWLGVQPHETVIDWFCGLGNFSLPLARQCKRVLGLEGSDALVTRARDNATRNGLAHKASFDSTDLFEIDAAALQSLPSSQAWLVDPPREGAMSLVKALAAARRASNPAWSPPERIVYVSCNPATLARDAGLLEYLAGYRLACAGVVNMFAHTAHVESMACFVLGDLPPVDAPSMIGIEGA